MPKLIRLYIRHCAIGFAIAAVFVALLLWLDVAHLRHLIYGKGEINFLALLILYLSHASVFGGVQFAVAVMGMAEPPTPPAGGKRQPAPLTPAPVMLPKRSGS